MARRKRSAIDRALYQMRPNKVLARYLSGGRHNSFKSIATSPFKTKTVHTSKTGRKAYQRLVAKQRKEQAKAAAAERRQRATDQRASRAQMRRQQPRTYRTAKGPIAVNARTGRPITYAEARAGMNAAQREVDRILAGLEGREPARQRPRRQPASPPLTPLQAAIKEVEAKQNGKTKAAAKKTTGTSGQRTRAAGKKTTAAKPRKRAKAKTTGGLAKAVAALIPDTAILAPASPERATPGAPATPTARPLSQRPRASRQARRGVYGEVLKRTCECGGTGRIPLHDANGDPHGSESCPRHGRRARGDRKWTARSAGNDAGLPGLAGFLEKKRRRHSKRLDKHQARSSSKAMYDLRHAGPTERCPETAHCDNGVWDRPGKDAERRAWIAAYIEWCRSVGKRVPRRAKLLKLASRALPYEHCHACGGLGVLATSIEVTVDGQMPVWEWREGARLKGGHRPTGRERSTGRRPTENAARVERRRILPRI